MRTVIALIVAQAVGIAVGQHAPAAAVTTLDRHRASLSQYVGHGPVVMEFWARWCQNCRELAPALQAAAQRHHDRVTFLTVAVAVDETSGDIAQFAHEHPFAGPVVYDTTGAAVDAYGVPGTSFVVVLDAKGTVVYTGVGGTQDIETALRKAL